jgi:hypothetical protein
MQFTSVSEAEVDWWEKPGMRRPGLENLERIHLQAPMQGGGGIEFQLSPSGREARTGSLVGWAEGGVFNDDGGTPAEARAGELRVKAPLPQCAQQRFFQKVGQADQLQIG